nr:hypothetical protein CFP56_58900 [Quercus suber]
MCDQCGCKAEDELHVIWDCDNIRDGWVPSFVDVRSNFQSIESMSDLGKKRQEPKQRAGPVWWQPPPEDTMKVNFDGAVFGEDQEARIGVVIHNEEGQVLATLFEKVMMPPSVEILEKLAARRAAIFA